MEEFLQLLSLDQGISVILSFIWVALIITIIRGLPKWIPSIIEAFREMANALERQSEVTENNSKLMEEVTEKNNNLIEMTNKVHMKTDERVSLIEKNIKELEESHHVLGQQGAQWAERQMLLLRLLYKEITGVEYTDSNSDQDMDLK